MFWIRSGLVGLGCIGLAKLALQLTVLWPMLWHPTHESSGQVSQSEFWLLAFGLIVQTAALVIAPLAIGAIGLARGWRIAKIAVPVVILAIAVYSFPSASNFAFSLASVFRLAGTPDGLFLAISFTLNFLTFVSCVVTLAGLAAWHFRPRTVEP